MLVFEFELSGNCKRDFDTEIRFNIASARFDSADLVIIKLPKKESDNENKRLLSCVSRTLGSLKKEGIIQLYLTPLGFSKMTTEAQYIINKFSNYVTEDQNSIHIYVKT